MAEIAIPSSVRGSLPCVRVDAVQQGEGRRATGQAQRYFTWGQGFDFEDGAVARDENKIVDALRALSDF
jgi:hypothetical protein